MFGQATEVHDLARILCKRRLRCCLQIDPADGDMGILGRGTVHPQHVPHDLGAHPQQTNLREIGQPLVDPVPEPAGTGFAHIHHCLAAQCAAQHQRGKHRPDVEDHRIVGLQLGQALAQRPGELQDAPGMAAQARVFVAGAVGDAVHRHAAANLVARAAQVVANGVEVDLHPPFDEFGAQLFEADLLPAHAGGEQLRDECDLHGRRCS